MDRDERMADDTLDPLAELFEAGEHAAKSPENCQTMADVRAGVDALDQALVALLTIRQGYMDAAARIKTSRAQVRDEARIEDVVAKVLASARATGLDPAIAEPVWRLLIERCIAYEFDTWDGLRKADTDPR